MESTVQGFRLSAQQRRAWLRRACAPTSRVQLALRLEGEPSEEALRLALRHLAAQHSALRTGFHRPQGIALPVQVVDDAAAPRLRREVVEEEARREDLERRELERPLDPEASPLQVLWVDSPSAHELILTLPSLCADRSSLTAICRDLAHRYADAVAGVETAPESAVRYVQYAEWQRQVLEEDGDEGRRFWRQRWPEPLRGRLPGERVAADPVPWPKERRLALDEAAIRGAEALASDLAVPVSTVALAAWQVLLWRHLQPEDPAVAVVLDGRLDERLEAAVGPFAQAAPVSAGLVPELPFRDAVARVQRSLEEAEEWQDVLAAATDAGTPDGPADLPFGFERVRPPAAEEGGSVRFVPVRTRGEVEAFHLSLHWVEGDGAPGAELHYDPRRFDADWAGRLAERWSTLLRSGVSDPLAPVGELEMVGEKERQWLVAETGRPVRPSAPYSPVHERIAEVAERTPAAVAVAGTEGRRVTYEELLLHAGRMGGRLRQLGVGPEVPVAIYLDRSPELVVAILAVLGAGGFYVPLDTVHPPERLAWMLADVRPALVVTRRAMAQRVSGSGVPVLCCDEPEDDAGDGGELVSPSAEALAYVLYTSGSTGRPKGVMVTHGGLAGYLDWAVAEYGLGPGSVVPVHSPAGFDLTVTALLGPLVAGGTTVTLPETEGVESLAAALREGGRFGLVKVTPSHLELLRHTLDGARELARIETLVVGGEPLAGESIASWRARLPGARVVNEYGPTETVVGCTAYEVPDEGATEGPVPIGRPAAGARAYVTDPRLRLTPAGLAGELVVGGPGVSRGYLRLPARTAERFVPDPFGGGPGERLYRTGDLARWLASADLEFLGRNDGQLKVRGFRVEPGEIEATLLRHPAVSETVVVGVQDGSGHRRLVAYLVAEGEKAPGVDELRRFLLETLPEPMVPSTFVPLDALPLTANGKLDRAALPDPSGIRPDLDREYLAPRTAGEEVLAELWATALGLERIGVRDNFFVLGGDSMRSVRLVALVNERGFACTVQDLYRHPTIEALAAHLGCGPGAAPAVEKPEADLLALLEEVERLDEEEVRERLRSAGPGVPGGAG